MTRASQARCFPAPRVVPGDAEKERMHEFHDVTAVEFARQFQEPQFVNEAAIAAIEARTG